MGIEQPDIPADELDELMGPEGTPEALNETPETDEPDVLVDLLDRNADSPEASGVTPEVTAETETPSAADQRYDELKNQNDWFRQQLEHAMAQRQQHQQRPAPPRTPQRPVVPDFLKQIAEGESVDPRIIEAQWNHALHSAVNPLQQQVAQMVGQQQAAAKRAEAEAHLNSLVETAQKAHPNTPRQYLLGRIVNAGPNETLNVTQYAREFGEMVDAEITRRGGTAPQAAESGSRKKVPRARRSGSGKSNESSKDSGGQRLQDVHDKLLRAVGKR